MTEAVVTLRRNEGSEWESVGKVSEYHPSLDVPSSSETDDIGWKLAHVINSKEHYVTLTRINSEDGTKVIPPGECGFDIKGPVKISVYHNRCSL